MSFKSDKCFGVMSGKPLTSYESEEEAIEGVNYIRDNFNNSVPMDYYECSKCGFYHIIPKSREKEIELCGCKDQDGDDLQLFDTRKSAKIKSDKLRKQDGIQRYIFPCPNSAGFHITDKDPENL